MKEERINELEERVKKLEKKERIRTIKSIIVLCFYGIIIIALLVTVIYGYYKIKPYKEKIDNLKETASKLKIDDVIDGTDGFSGLDGFNGFDFFSNFFN